MSKESRFIQGIVTGTIGGITSLYVMDHLLVRGQKLMKALRCDTGGELSYVRATHNKATIPKDKKKL